MIQKIEDIEDYFDGKIIDSLLTDESFIIPESIRELLFSIGWTDTERYYYNRLNILEDLGFVINNDIADFQDGFITETEVSPKVRAAYDAGIFKTGAELFDPSPRQRVFLKMWGINPTSVYQ